MTRYPLAVIAPAMGKPSETFIQRHITELLPGRTVVVVRDVATETRLLEQTSPCLNIRAARSGWRWARDAASFGLGLSSLSPVQLAAARFLEQHDVHVILSEYLDFSLKWLPVAKRTGSRFFAHAHGADVSKQLRDPAMRRRYLQLEEADGVITMSAYSRDRLIELGLSGMHIHVVPYGIHVPRVPHCRLPGEAVRCLAVGRMVAKKAPIATLEAFRRARAECPELRLDFVGAGEQFQEVKHFVQGNNLETNVILHGAQPNRTVLRLMRNCDVFLQHSITDPVTGDQEGLPVAILEAMASSLPILSTRHAGIPEAVIHGETGLLVNEGDVSSMAESLIVLAGDADLRKRLGLAAWRRAREHFTWDREREALRSLLGF